MSALIGAVLSELSDTNHEGAARCLHHVVGDRVQPVDPQDALDLDEQPVEQAKVAARYPHDGGDRLRVGEIRFVHREPEVAPAPGQHEGQFLILQRPVLMGEADTAEKLCISLHPLFDARHPNQDQADTLPVEQVAQIFQPSVGQAVGFIDDQQFDEMLSGRNYNLAFGPDMLIDADVDPVDEARQVLSKFAQRAADGRRIEHGTRTREVRIYLEIGLLPRTPGHEQIDCAVPTGVAARGQRFADAGRAVTQADVAVLADGVGKLGNGQAVLQYPRDIRRVRGGLNPNADP